MVDYMNAAQCNKCGERYWADAPHTCKATEETLFDIENQIVERSSKFRTFKSADEHRRYMIVALAGEVGEAANLIKKNWRGDFVWHTSPKELKDEFSDIFVYWLLNCHAHGWTMYDMIVHANEKAERKLQQILAERASR